ncbi:MAG TPA: SpoIIE family protein phosphatase [Patescibacteria group bacterium]|nr:SpoIIE family protein phosphatase [Patescibacteria group bacterium]
MSERMLSARVTMLKGLVFKQARATMVIALLVGLSASFFELVSDLKAERETLGATTVQILSMVNSSASEAAFQMNQELAHNLVTGLFQYQAVQSASLRDNFGNIMAHKERPHTETSLTWLADKLFVDSTEFLLPLFHRNADGSDEPIGELSVSLDPRTVAAGFFSRAAIGLVTTLARIIGVCVLFIALFYVMITKPLLRLQSDIGKVDPAEPGQCLLPAARSHEDDELGLLVRTLNGLLTAFQTGLQARDTAQGELTELARTLEQRVIDRTNELARQKDGVERALAQLNAAHAELNKVNRHINESIRYASRIQTSLLPDNSSLDGMLHDIAVGWSPRDVVGGDFYWIGRFGDRCIISVMDCTGHGVPGAFMTAIVASVLDRILHEHCHDDPAMILQLLNRLVKASLRQEQHEHAGDIASDDGLDAAICLIDNQRGTLTYAGANIPLLYAVDNHIHEVKGDRHSLGYRTSRADFAFTNHVVPMTAGMAFYLATDGVTDQVGGPHRRLFGRRRLSAALRDGLELSMHEQMQRIFLILSDYRGEESRRDDMTFIGFVPLPPVAAMASVEALL